MTQTDELTDTENGLAPAGQISDEDLEAVTGGLTRPLGPDPHDLHGADGRPDAGHDDTGDA